MARAILHVFLSPCTFLALYTAKSGLLLELELEGELDGARAADLVKRIETAIRAARAEADRKHLRGVAK